MYTPIQLILNNENKVPSYWEKQNITTDEFSLVLITFARWICFNAVVYSKWLKNWSLNKWGRKPVDTNSSGKWNGCMLLLLSRFSRVRLCATPETPAHQAPPSLGFSRQERWSGLPFPSPMHESEKRKWSHSVVSDS